ncbi:predicted protein [Sclerotinia sclerotiorum 1980 UF-70]|uniref:Uncharacterized protein n=1 Tax=Sclerotinia sclerotiorum (strain ATCC 18683 / 1980 / Ss-1) TaxID=665079 RepID=A7ENM0_SCLS1|nr:predicted protein [Sclerotinia sclerotiorum 1980 UF-70]EDO04436.1 predicted protein [Sclerotinia sclerotiorum 1980 UF-70]
MMFECWSKKSRRGACRRKFDPFCGRFGADLVNSESLCRWWKLNRILYRATCKISPTTVYMPEELTSNY